MLVLLICLACRCLANEWVTSLEGIQEPTYVLLETSSVGGAAPHNRPRNVHRPTPPTPSSALQRQHDRREKTDSSQLGDRPQDPRLPDPTGGGAPPPASDPDPATGPPRDHPPVHSDGARRVSPPAPYRETTVSHGVSHEVSHEAGHGISHPTNVHGRPLRFRHPGKPRPKRQLLYYVLSFLGEDGIRSYVRNTKTENFPALMGSVSGDEIIYIVSSLEPSEIMRVLTSLPAADVLTMAGKLTPPQLMQLLSFVPQAGLANLTEGFSPAQLQQLVVLLPPEGIVNLTLAVPPKQAKKLMGSLSPEFIFNMTQSMSSATLVALMTALPPEIFVDFTRSLHPDDLEKLMKSMPPEVYMTVVSKLTTPMLKQLLQTLPDGFIESFMDTLAPEDLGKMVKNVKAEDVAKLLRAFPAGHGLNLNLNVTKLMRPEMMSAVMESLPKDLIANLTTILPAKKLSGLVASISPDHLLAATQALSAQQMADMVMSIPPAALAELVSALPPDLLVTLAESMPVDTIVNISNALAGEPQALATLMESVKPELVRKFSSAFRKEFVLQILERLPSDTIGKMAAALPVRKAGELMSSLALSDDAPPVDVHELLKGVPSGLVAKLVTSVPPEVVARLSQQLTRSQLRTIIRLVTPELLHVVVTSVPPDAMINIARALPESVLINSLAVLQPKHFRNLVQAVPVETIQKLIDSALAEDPAVGHSTEELIASTQKVANIMLSLQPDALTRLIKAIPKEVLVQVVDSLPAQALADGAAILSGEEGVPLASALPIQAVAYAVSVIPPSSIVRIVDALPTRTIGAFANMAMKIPHERIQAFFGLVQIGALRNMMTKLPPRTIEKLVSSVPLETVSKMAQSFDPVTMAPLMDSLRPRELRRIIRSVNSTTLSNLFNSIPPDVIVNLTQALPPDQIAKLMEAIPPEIIAQVVTHMDPKSMISLMKALPPSIVENMLTTLPTGLIVNMTKLLPPESLQELMDLLPKHMMGKMIAILPKDVLVDLVKVFDAEAMLNMMQKLEPKQLMDILAMLPPQVILNITKSQTPEQTLKMLNSMPSEGIVNLTSSLPPEIMMEMMQSLPPAGLLAMMGSLPLKDLFTLAKQLTPEQTAKMIEKFAADKDLIPNLLAQVDMEFLASRLEAIPADLIMQVASAVDMKVVMGMVTRFVPKVQTMVLEMMDRGLKKLARNSTLSFHRCLDDLGLVAHSLFNFSEWAFHFVDASGKPGRGMLEGNIHMIGNYDQCKKINHVVDGGVRNGDVIAGSYCHVQFQIPLELLPPIPGDGILPMPEIALDLCLPNSCRDFDLHNLLKSVRIPMNVTVPRVLCQQDANMMDDPAAVIVVVVVLILVFFVAVGTILDCLLLRRSVPISDNNNKYIDARTNIRSPIYTNGHSTSKNCGSSGDDDIKCVEKLLQKDPEFKGADTHEMKKLMTKKGGDGANVDNVSQHSYIAEHSQKLNTIIVDADEPLWLRALTVFSIARSMRTLLIAPDNEDNILCLHGVRVLSMLWVIFANSVVFAALNFENLLHAANDLISMPAQVILNSSLSQDTFFTVSGVLTAVAFLKGLQGKTSTLPLLRNILYYYVHRLVRVVPAYAVVLAVCASLIGYVADGPHWPPPLQQQCQEQWWKNLLFINNYFITIEHMCMSWTWFLANLMQFYWIAPLILVPFALGGRWKFVGFAGVGGLIAIHIVATVILELGVNGDVLRRQSEYFWHIYQQPWCRVAPYAMGLGLGYVLHRLHYRCPGMHWVVSVVGWVVCFALSTTLCMITYDENRYLLTDAAGWSLGSRTAHETLQRPLWGLVVSWVVFACSTGNGGPINTALSWKGFLPLSRLTLCVYLIHPIVILCDLFSYRVFAYFSIGYVVFRYIGYVVVAYFAALVLSVLTQSPFLNLERTIIDAWKRPSKIV